MPHDASRLARAANEKCFQIKAESLKTKTGSCLAPTLLLFTYLSLSLSPSRSLSPSFCCSASLSVFPARACRSLGSLGGRSAKRRAISKSTTVDSQPDEQSRWGRGCWGSQLFETFRLAFAARVDCKVS